jgi:gluconate 5-dehydrogenase
MNASMFDLSGRTALVTGGGSGLGLAIALGVACAGAKVVIVGRNEARLNEAAKSHALAGVQCDLTDRTQVSELPRTLAKRGFVIDILFNNAGVQHRAPFLEFPAARWDDVINTHLSGPYLLAQAIAPMMIDRGHGKIINTLSVNAELARPGISAYASAKGGLRMLTKALAAELAVHNIQCNGLAPGYFRTEMTAALVADVQFDNWVKARTPAGRWGEPRDLVGPAIFLASAASDFVNGQTLFVDGGMTAVV